MTIKQGVKLALEIFEKVREINSFKRLNFLYMIKRKCKNKKTRRRKAIKNYKMIRN